MGIGEYPRAMPDSIPDRPRTGARPPRTGWRWITPAVAAFIGAMFWVSHADARGTEWRPQRYSDLTTIVEEENDDVTAQNARVRELTEEIDQLTSSVSDRRVQEARTRERGLRPQAGLTPVSGPAVTVTLSDSPVDVIERSDLDRNLHVVHQQDIQRVVNAMWEGGAEAITIQGQRLVTTTGIKCEGTAILLQGIAYPQPYVIQAVGDQAQILARIESDSYLDIYRDQAENPAIRIGWDLSTQTNATAAAYDGPLTAQFARPAT